MHFPLQKLRPQTLISKSCDLFRPDPSRLICSSSALEIDGAEASELKRCLAAHRLECTQRGVTKIRTLISRKTRRRLVATGMTVQFLSYPFCPQMNVSMPCNEDFPCSPRIDGERSLMASQLLMETLVRIINKQQNSLGDESLIYRI